MRLSVFAIAAVLGGLAVSSAEAMPVSATGSITAVVRTAAEAPVVKVDYACGRGWRLTRWGECRPRRWGPPRGYGYYRPAPPPPWGYYGHRPHRDRWERDGRRERRRDW
ncbi:GCG_CRPN prefix-to-repeats domain-containing protein [Rhizobium rhizogenes]|uniref:GCG_CRPN prefix-to-repeats domain-containing protein n=1 Tax=Rhizobium rhizogenes TaxID=359 RepID=UPI001573CA94|nr:hypothetical protein [Rhizobium rhizogenes]NTG39513.1 hypothetical protein [Rhizobium rhizogenes]